MSEKDEFGINLVQYSIGHAWPEGYAPGKGAIVAFSAFPQKLMTVMDHQVNPNTGGTDLWCIFTDDEGSFGHCRVPQECLILHSWSIRKDIPKWQKNLPPQQNEISPSFESASAPRFN